MSIIWIRPYVTSGGASIDLTAGPGNVKYKKHFQVLTDDYDDGPQTISAHPSFPQPYEIYSAGTDYDADAVATKASIDRDKNQPLLWVATITYTVIPGMSGGTPGTIDITHFTPSVRSWKIPYEEILVEAYRQLIGTNLAAPIETHAAAMLWPKVVVQNSVGTQYADAIVTVKHATAYEIRRYEWYYNATLADTLQDTVNSAVFWTFAAGTVKMVSITGNLTNVKNTLVYQVSYEFHVRSDGWGEPIPDSGYYRHSTANGGIPANAAAITGVCKVRDQPGTPMGSPVLLNGAGYSGGVSVEMPTAIPPAVSTPYVVRWHTIEPGNFATITPTFPTRASLNII